MSKPQISIPVTTGPGATTQSFLTGFSRYCAAFGAAIADRVAPSLSTARVHPATASRAALPARPALSQPSPYSVNAAAGPGRI